MTHFQFNSIWVPIFSFENEESVRLLIKNGLTLASWLGANLHCMISEHGDPAVRRWIEAVGFKNGRNGGLRCSVISIPGIFVRELPKQISEQENGVILLNADQMGLLGLSQGLSREKIRLLERCQLPIWIIPAKLKMKSDPVKAVWVPMSGEKRANEALALGIQLGNQHDIPVDILHVTSAESRRECDESVLGHITDQFHHEYPGLVNELITQGSPFSSLQERQVIRDFCHCYGDVTRELKRRIRKNSESLLIFEWKGSLKKGRAQKIKLLLRHARGSILLIREDSKARSHLKIGRQFGAAS